MASSSNSPCAACKFLRRKCTLECVFAPYFPPDQPQKFANVHKIFGASNVTKLLNELQPHQREDAVNSLAYEAEARVKDPVYGCVGAISILQHQVKQLQAELHSARSELSKYISAGMGMPQTLSSALAGAPSSCSPPLGMGMALPLSSVLSPRDHNIFRDHHHHQIMQAETQQHLSRDHHLLRGGSVNFVEQPDIVRISGGGSPYHDPHVTAAANVAYLPLTVTSGGNVSHAMVSHFSSADRAASPQEEHQHHQAALMSSPYSLQQVKGEE